MKRFGTSSLFGLALSSLTLALATGCPPNDPPSDAGVDAGIDAGADAGEDAGVDAGEDAGEDPILDSGVDAGEDAGIDAGEDAGEEDAGDDAGIDAGEIDAGEIDAGIVEPTEPGDRNNPLRINIPGDFVDSISPVGDSDCYIFTTTAAGEFTAQTRGIGGGACPGDTRLLMFTSGNTTTAIFNDDDSGDGTCSLVTTVLLPGEYIICAEHFTNGNTINNVETNIEFSGFVCGNEVVDPGEECDSTAGCSAECLVEDELPREFEDLGNNDPNGIGVFPLNLNEPARGQIAPVGDEDWWLIDLPGSDIPGALDIRVGNIDLSANSCGSASAVQADLFTLDNLTTPVVTLGNLTPCRGVVLKKLLNDPIFGNETLLLRVKASSSTLSYHVRASFVTGQCGNGTIEAAEECEPSSNPRSPFCDPDICYFVPPPNDECTGAISINVPTDGSQAVAFGNTLTAKDHSNASCISSSGRTGSNDKDVFFTFVAPADGNITATLGPTGFDAIVSLHDGDACSNTEITCTRANSNNAGAAKGAVVAGNTYTIVVDAFNAASGAFALFVSYDVVPANDTCAAATDITNLLAIDGTKTRFIGDTRIATNDASALTSACQDATGIAQGKEVFYTFTAAASGVAAFELDSIGWNAVLYAQEGGCDTPTERICRDNPETIEFPVVEGTQYTVVVDARGGESGVFTLDGFYIDVPDNDLCEAAQDLPVILDGPPVVVTGDTRGAANNDSPTTGRCQTTTASNRDHRDVFYRVIAEGTGLLNVELLDPETGTLFDASLYAIDTCGGADLACGRNPDSISLPVVEGQEVLLVVDGFNTAAAGSFTLQASLSTVFRADSCEEAAPLVGNSGTITGEITDQVDTYSSDDFDGCTGFSSAGKDVVYSLSLDPGQTAEVFYDADDEDNDESLYVLDTCPPVADSCIDGSDIGGSAGETVFFTNDTGERKTYFIVLDEFAFGESTGGAYALTWTIE